MVLREQRYSTYRRRRSVFRNIAQGQLERRWLRPGLHGEGGEHGKGTSTSAIATSSAPSANRRHMRGGSLARTGSALTRRGVFALEKAIMPLGACRPDRHSVVFAIARRWHVADPECNRRIGAGVVIACVAKHKPASTVSGEQSDRPLSAGASRPTGPWLAFPADAHLARRRSWMLRARADESCSRLSVQSARRARQRRSA